MDGILFDFSFCSALFTLNICCKVPFSPVSHIGSIGVAAHFWSNSLGLLRNLSKFIQSSVTSDIAALMLTLSVNGPLAIISIIFSAL